MNVKKPILVVLAWLIALPLAAQTGSTPEEREENRRRLERLKDQPETMAKARKKAIFFASLPEERRKQLLDLDQKLQQEPLATRKRLEKALERYSSWLEGLDSNQRKRIKEAPDSKTRLEIIKRTRAEEWLKKQPKAVQEELAKLDADKSAKRIAELRAQQRKQKNHWEISSRFWEDLSRGRPMPVRLSDFDGDITTFFNEYLAPRLSPKEKTLLKDAEGKWPLFPMTLVALADRHPLALPGDKMFRRWDELPAEVKKRLTSKKGGLSKAVKLADGTQRFPQVISDMARRRKIALPHELWPYGFDSLSPPVRKFVKDKLTPILDVEEKLALKEATKWPDYPVTLKKLADNHDLEIPWSTLPGNSELWDKYRLRQRLPH